MQEPLRASGARKKCGKTALLRKATFPFDGSSHTVSGPRQSGTIQKFVWLKVRDRKSTPGFLVKLFGGQRPISPPPLKASEFKVKSEVAENIDILV